MSASNSQIPYFVGNVPLEEEEQLRLLASSLHDYALFTLDTQGRIASWNAVAEQLSGFSSTEVIGQSVEILFASEDREEHYAQGERNAACEKGCVDTERWYQRKDGSRFWATGILTALRTADGGLRGYANLLRDVTERKQEQARATQILETITDAFFALDTHWHFTYLNAQAELLLQRSKEELLGKYIWKEFAQAVGSTFYEMYHHALKEQTTVTFEEFYPPLDTWFSVRAYPSREGLAVYFQNIDARKAEETRQRHLVRRSTFAAEVGNALNCRGTLAQSLQACAVAMVQHLDAAFARVWTLNTQTDVLELQASAGLYTHLAGPHSRVPVGQFKIGLIAAERLPHLTNTVIGDPRVGDQEWAHRERMVAFAGYPLLIEDQVVGVMAMFSRDPITEDTLNALALVADTLAQTIQRKRGEEALQMSEQQWRTTLRSIGDGVITTDAATCIRFMNPMAETLTGWTQEEAVGHDAREVFRIVNEQTRQEVDSPLVRAIEQGMIVGLANHTILIARDGTERIVEDSGAPIRDTSGDITGAVLVFRDATERHQAETEIRTLNVRLQHAITETHHRVKNNLQLMAALIDMQRASGEETVPMSELARLGIMVGRI